MSVENKTLKAAAKKKVDPKWNAGTAEAVVEALPGEVKLKDLTAQIDPSVASTEVIPAQAGDEAVRAGNFPHVEIDGVILQPEKSMKIDEGLSFDEFLDIKIHSWRIHGLLRELPNDMLFFLFKFQHEGRQKFLVTNEYASFVSNKPVKNTRVRTEEDPYFKDLYDLPVLVGSDKTQVDVLLMVNSHLKNTSFFGYGVVYDYPLVSGSTLISADIRHAAVGNRLNSPFPVKNDYHHRTFERSHLIIENAYIYSSAVMSSIIKNVHITEGSSIFDSSISATEDGHIDNSTVNQSTIQCPWMRINRATVAANITSSEEVSIANTQFSDFNLYNCRHPVIINSRFGHGEFDWITTDEVRFYTTRKGLVLVLPYSLMRAVKDIQGNEIVIPFLNYEDKVDELISKFIVSETEYTEQDISVVSLSLFKYLKDQIKSRIGVVLEINRIIELGHRLNPVRPNDVMPF